MSEHADRSAAARAAGRASWPVRTLRLRDEPSDDLSAFTTPEERLDMMWPLALEAWSWTGVPLPDYPRSQAPVRLSYRGDSSRT